MILIFFGFLTECANSSKTNLANLKEYIDRIKVIDTHEHQRWFPQYDGQDINFFTILNHSYLQADLISAGAPRLDTESISEGDLEELWETFGQYLDFSQNTSYYSQFLKGFQILYGFNDSRFTKGGIRSLSEQIAMNYKDRNAWYERAFEKAGFEIMLVDQYWAPFNTDLNPRFFALVFNINNLVSATTQRTAKYREDAPLSVSLFKLADHEGYSIKTLDEYLAFAGHLFQKFLDRNAICIKNSMAYGRTLYYEDVPYERAEELFSRNSSSLTREEKKELEDFMFHWICQKSIELDLPFPAR